MLDGHIGEWIHLGLRWLHVVAGAAWIGTSFYFNFLNNALRPPHEQGDGRVSGELWAIHGGGFYHVEKFKVAPERLPETLHWFKWEAYTTWISGFSLLAVVYYLGPSGLLTDRSGGLSRAGAVALGIGVLVLGWFLYDALCSSRLLEHSGWFTVVGLVVVTGVAFGLSQVFSGRAAYIHVGALLGTLMAGNVFLVIIPSQREMVAAMQEDREPDGTLGRQAGLRSLHNNYLTLPVLFVMVSNHFPTTYGHALNWAVLAGVAIAGAAIRHWFNLRGQGRRNAYILPAAAVMLVGLAFVTVPRSTVSTPAGEAVPDDQAMAIVERRCTACHAPQPSDPGFNAPPQGITLTSLEEVRARIDAIERVAVDSTYMPLGNVTGMTDEERAQLGGWIDQQQR